MYKGARANPSGLIEIMYDIFVFNQDLPFKTKECLAKSAEVRSFEYKYNIDYTIDYSALSQYMQTFVNENFLMVHQWTVDWH